MQYKYLNIKKFMNTEIIYKLINDFIKSKGINIKYRKQTHWTKAKSRSHL